MDFKKILEMVNDDEYKQAENELLGELKTDSMADKEIGYTYYLLGYFHTTWRNKDRNKASAKKYLLKSINSKEPDPRAYQLYADIEDDKNVALNYLKDGLAKFEKNPNILQGLLKHEHENEKVKTIDLIKNNDLTDYNLLIDVISYLVRNNQWDDIRAAVTQLKKGNDINEADDMFLALIDAYSYILSQKEVNAELALKLFEQVLVKDVDNNFRYSHYLGAIYAAILLNDFDTVNYYFDKLPVNNSISDLDSSPWHIIDLDFYIIYKQIFDAIISSFKNDAERKLKAKCLYSLYLYYPSELFEVTRYKKSDIANVDRYYRKYPSDNLGKTIFNMKCGLKMYFSAYETFFELLGRYIDTEKNDMDFSDVIYNSSPTEFQNIYNDLVNKIREKYDMDYKTFIHSVFDLLAPYLFKQNQYSKIASIANFLPMQYLKESKYKFETAYSLNEINQTGKAEYLYTVLIEEEPNNCSALNNLGVIFERKGDLIQAHKNYKLAVSQKPNEDLYYQNLNRVSGEIKKFEIAYENIRSESAWFIERVSLVYERANNEGILSCTYKERTNLLKVKPAKANELFDKFCKEGYLRKISDGSLIPSTYKVNPLVNDFILKNQERLNANKEYELITESLCIDTIEKYGYTQDLIKRLDSIKDENFKNIIKRDIKECVITLITKQYKASTILCGSIIEAILVNNLHSKGVLDYDIGIIVNQKSKTKKIKDMDLNELLEVAIAEKEIKPEEYHLSSYLRHYRNIIHPSCEIRKNYDINEDSAELMWKILLKLICELL